MMTGKVENRTALLPVPLHLPNGGLLAITFIIDTGFTGYLTLPPDAVSHLGLPFVRDMNIFLADTSRKLIAVHRAIIRWHDIAISTEVLAVDGDPLLGTSLLDGSQVNIPFEENGSVTIELL